MPHSFLVPSIEFPPFFPVHLPFQTFFECLLVKDVPRPSLAFKGCRAPSLGLPPSTLLTCDRLRSPRPAQKTSWPLAPLSPSPTADLRRSAAAPGASLPSSARWRVECGPDGLLEGCRRPEGVSGWVKELLAEAERTEGPGRLGEEELEALFTVRGADFEAVGRCLPVCSPLPPPLLCNGGGGNSGEELMVCEV